MLDDLERITKLWKDGALTDAEFEAQKEKLLATSNTDPDWEEWEEPKKSKAVIYGLWALILVVAGTVVGLAYYYTKNDQQILTSNAELDESVYKPSPTAPDALKLSVWGKASEGCSGDDWKYQFSDQYYITILEGEIYDQTEVLYDTTENGWRVIRNDGVDIYQKSGDEIEFLGRKIEGILIRPSKNKVPMKQCTEDDFLEPLSGKSSSFKPKEPLRAALWLAMMWKDAEAAERIVKRMPTLEGGINLKGDPDDEPDLDTMLTLTSREVYVAIQRVRGEIVPDNPEGPYTVDGQPWKNVDAFPTVMQAEFASAVGCDLPMRFTSNSLVFRSDVSVAKRIAISGNRVLMEEEDGLKILYELHPDGSISQLAMLMKSGRLAPDDRVQHRDRCSLMPTSPHNDDPEPIPL